MIRKAIERHIRILESERTGMIGKSIFYPPGSLAQQRLNLGIKLWTLKIAIWQSLIKKKKIEIDGIIFKTGRIYDLKYCGNEENEVDYFSGKAKIMSIDDDGTIHWKGIGDLKGTSGGFRKGKVVR